MQPIPPLSPSDVFTLDSLGAQTQLAAEALDEGAVNTARWRDKCGIGGLDKSISYPRALTAIPSLTATTSSLIATTPSLITTTSPSLPSLTATRHALGGRYRRISCHR